MSDQAIKSAAGIPPIYQDAPTSSLPKAVRDFLDKTTVDEGFEQHSIVFDVSASVTVVPGFLAIVAKDVAVNIGGIFYITASRLAHALRGDEFLYGPEPNIAELFDASILAIDYLFIEDMWDMLAPDLRDHLTDFIHHFVGDGGRLITVTDMSVGDTGNYGFDVFIGPRGIIEV